MNALRQAQPASIPRRPMGGSPGAPRPNAPRNRLTSLLSVTSTSVALLCGCEIRNSFQEAAQELANPDPETVEEGGRLVVEGSFRNLRFDGSTADDAFVVAIESKQELIITPFSGAKGCSAGPATRFVESVSRTNDEDAHLDSRIPFEVPATDDEPRTLRFTNFACDLDSVSVPNGDLPLDRSFAKEPGVLVQNRVDGELYFVSPWDDRKTRIASKLQPIYGGDLGWIAPGIDNKTWLWTLEDGQVVARDANFDEVLRVGKDVASIVLSAGGADGPMLGLRQRDGTLSYTLAGDPDKSTVVDTDACGVQFNTGAHGRELVYFSPCGDRNLNVFELETDTHRTIRSGIVDYRIVGDTETGPVLLYVTEPTTEPGIGTVWARWGQNEPIKLGESGNLRLARFSSSKRRARIVLDWSGESGALYSGVLGEEMEKIADAVAYYGSAGVITDFDGNNGDLYALDDDELTPIIKNVSTRGIRTDAQKDRALFLSDFDGVEGQLTLVESGVVRRMTKRVRPGAYQFTALLPMVTLLSDLDEETNTATLRLHRTDRDEVLHIADGVVETVEVAWPTEGLLYSAPAADPPGIYFARAL